MKLLLMLLMLIGTMFGVNFQEAPVEEHTQENIYTMDEVITQNRMWWSDGNLFLAKDEVEAYVGQGSFWQYLDGQDGKKYNAYLQVKIQNKYWLFETGKTILIPFTYIKGDENSIKIFLIDDWLVGEIDRNIIFNDSSTITVGDTEQEYPEPI
jgi:hypothetical protein